MCWFKVPAFLKYSNTHECGPFLLAGYYSKDAIAYGNLKKDGYSPQPEVNLHPALPEE
jgi:hypothetical protein